MFTVEQSIVINCPIEQVFAYVTNPSNITKWRPDVLAVNGASGSVVAGDTFDELVNFMGRKTFTMQVVECQPHQREVIQAISGPGVKPTQTFQFESRDGGTYLSITANVRTSGLFRLMEPMMPAMFSKTWTQYLSNLKHILEN
jgi:dehydrogenase/reductase SDR family member 12